MACISLAKLTVSRDSNSLTYKRRCKGVLECQPHINMLYLCTLPKRKTSIRGSAGLQRLKFCVLQRKRRQRLLNEAVSEHGLSHGVGL